jgi:hypothetical protein
MPESPGLSLGNGYTINLTDGWTFVHALQDSLDQLQEGWNTNCRDLQIPPPGNDAHSKTFSTSVTQTAVSAHAQWYNQQVQKLGTMVQNVTGILHQYGIAETENTIQWTATDTSSVGSTAPESKGGGRGAS